MIKAEKVKLDSCPFCRGEVELWKYREIIKNRFICKKCKVEIEFPRGLDTVECVKRWNRRNTKSRGVTAALVDKQATALSETICMDSGPSQFKTIKYKPTCPHGHIDCVLDPAYIKATYPEWYAKLHGGATNPEFVSCDKVGYCLNGERYDDEDK